MDGLLDLGGDNKILFVGFADGLSDGISVGILVGFDGRALGLIDGLKVG